jgi:hypothetical protein
MGPLMPLLLQPIKRRGDYYFSLKARRMRSVSGEMK